MNDETSCKQRREPYDLENEKKSTSPSHDLPSPSAPYWDYPVLLYNQNLPDPHNQV